MSSRFTPDAMVWVDLDDTVWDMSGNSEQCLAELFAEEGIDRFFADCDSWSRVYHEVNASLWHRYSHGEITRGFLRRERFAEPLRLAGVDADEAARLSDYYDGAYLSRLGGKSGLVDGAREFLDYLRGRGYRLGVLSNGFREVQYEKMRSGGIDRYFDVVVLSDEIEVNKPDRRLFDHAVSKAGSGGCVNVMVGDNVDADIAGAVGAGWPAIWYNPGNKPLPESLASAEVYQAATLGDICGRLL